MAKTNPIPSDSFAVSLGGDSHNYIIIEDGKLSFANPEATHVVCSNYFSDEELTESFPTLPRENITIEHEEVLAARGLAQPLMERFILVNLQNKHHTVAMITRNEGHNYSWQHSEVFWGDSLAEIIRLRFNIEASDDYLEDLTRQLEDFRNGKATDRLITLCGKDVHAHCDVEVTESLEVLLARCTANEREAAEKIREFVKHYEEDRPEAIYITGKLHLYPELQNELEKELQGALPIIVPEHAEDALQRGMSLTLERDRLLNIGYFSEEDEKK